MQTLLIVDDDVVQAEVLAYGLREAGYRVVIAHTGPEALVALHYIELALVICDVMLPGLNGDRVVAMMQSHPRLMAIPVIMTSALPVGMYSDLAAAAWLRKPYRWATLHDTVRAVLDTPSTTAGAVSDSGSTGD